MWWNTELSLSRRCSVWNSIFLSLGKKRLFLNMKIFDGKANFLACAQNVKRIMIFCMIITATVWMSDHVHGVFVNKRWGVTVSKYKHWWGRLRESCEVWVFFVHHLLLKSDTSSNQSNFVGGVTWCRHRNEVSTIKSSN